LTAYITVQVDRGWKHLGREDINFRSCTKRTAQHDGFCRPRTRRRNCLTTKEKKLDYPLLQEDIPKGVQRHRSAQRTGDGSFCGKRAENSDDTACRSCSTRRSKTAKVIRNCGKEALLQKNAGCTQFSTAITLKDMQPRTKSVTIAGKGQPATAMRSIMASDRGGEAWKEGEPFAAVRRSPSNTKTPSSHSGSHRSRRKRRQRRTQPQFREGSPPTTTNNAIDARVEKRKRSSATAGRNLGHDGDEA
jgi:hypothetical protein